MTEKKKFLDLKPLLRAVDLRDKNYYSKLSAEDKKLFSAFMTMRYVSSVDGDRFFQEHYVEQVNECVNKNLWDLNKHPELVWKLMTITGVTQAQFHPYIHSGGKGKSKNTRRNKIAQVLSMAKDSDIELFEKINDPKDIDRWLDEHGIN